MKRILFLNLLLFIFAGYLAAQKITVTSSGKGDTWERGKTYSIRWQQAGSMDNRVKLRLFNSTSTAKILQIADGITINGKYSWTIPAVLAPGKYTIRIKTMDNKVWDDSEVFQISLPSVNMVKIDKFVPGRIDVIKPAQGETIYTGDIYTLKWFNHGVVGSRVKIMLIHTKNPQNNGLIADDVPNEGSRKLYTWNTALQRTNRYLVRIQDKGNVIGESKPFSIIYKLTRLLPRMGSKRFTYVSMAKGQTRSLQLEINDCPGCVDGKDGLIFGATPLRGWAEVITEGGDSKPSNNELKMWQSTDLKVLILRLVET